LNEERGKKEYWSPKRTFEVRCGATRTAAQISRRYYPSPDQTRISREIPRENPAKIIQVNITSVIDCKGEMTVEKKREKGSVGVSCYGDRRALEVEDKGFGKSARREG